MDRSLVIGNSYHRQSCSLYMSPWLPANLSLSAGSSLCNRQYHVEASNGISHSSFGHSKMPYLRLDSQGNCSSDEFDYGTGVKSLRQPDASKLTKNLEMARASALNWFARGSCKSSNLQKRSLITAASSQQFGSTGSFGINLCACLGLDALPKKYVVEVNLSARLLSVFNRDVLSVVDNRNVVSLLHHTSPSADLLSTDLLVVEISPYSPDQIHSLVGVPSADELGIALRCGDLVSASLSQCVSFKVTSNSSDGSCIEKSCVSAVCCQQPNTVSKFRCGAKLRFLCRRKNSLKIRQTVKRNRPIASLSNRHCCVITMNCMPKNRPSPSTLFSSDDSDDSILFEDTSPPSDRKSSHFVQIQLSENESSECSSSDEDGVDGSSLSWLSDGTGSDVMILDNDCSFENFMANLPHKHNSELCEMNDDDLVASLPAAERKHDDADECDDTRIHAINARWNEFYTPANTFGSSHITMVQFTEELSFVTVLNGDEWAEAYREARLGSWTVDRQRFEHRIQQTEEQIAWIFSAQHRSKWITTAMSDDMVSTSF